MTKLLMFIILTFFASCSTTLSTYDANRDNYPSSGDLDAKYLKLNVYSKKLSDRTLSSGKVFIFPATPGVSITNRYFKMFSNYLYALLEMNGLEAAKVPEKAEIGILLDYHIGFPQTVTKTKTVPVKENGRVRATSDQRKDQYYLPIANKEYRWWKERDYHTVTEVMYLYRTTISIEAFDLIHYRESGDLHKKTTLYKTVISNVGKSNRLETLFPFMLVGASEFIGVNLDRPQSVYQRADDRRVAHLVDNIKLHKEYVKSIYHENYIYENYYMIPDPSRSRRLRLNELPVNYQF